MFAGWPVVPCLREHLDDAECADRAGWSAPMAPADYRGLTPLIYPHSNPYGPSNVDLERRLISRERGGLTPQLNAFRGVNL